MTSLAFGIFVFLFLFIFHPFGLERTSAGRMAKIASYYGVLCFLILLIALLVIPRLFPGAFQECKWTVWKEILHIIACTLAVSVGNIIFSHLYFGERLDGALILNFGWFTFSVGIIPITLLVMYRQIRLIKAFGREAAELNDRMAGADHREMAGGATGADRETPGVDQVLIGSENGQESVRLSVRSFLYAEAADNYVKLFYIRDGKPAQKMIRSTLKRLEEGFRGHEGVYRCHRTYLVNMDKIIHIAGNAQGYKLYLEGVEAYIPVSRNLNRQIAGLVVRPKAIPDSPTDL